MPRVLAGRKCRDCGGTWQRGHECNAAMMLLKDIKKMADKHAARHQDIADKLRTLVGPPEKIAHLHSERGFIEYWMQELTTVYKEFLDSYLPELERSGYDRNLLASLKPSYKPQSPTAVLMQEANIMDKHRRQGLPLVDTGAIARELNR